MIVNNLNVNTVEQRTFAVPVEEHKIFFLLSYEDVSALGRLGSRWSLSSHHEILTRAMEERHTIKELTLSKMGRHANKGTIWLEKDVRKKVIQEAADLGLEVGDYIRGILYSLNEKLMNEEMAERERQDKIRHDNRVLSFSAFVNPDVRKKLYKRYGKLNDNELMAAAAKDVGEWLAALK